MTVLILDTETTGLPKNYKAPVTDTENWPRLVQIVWKVYENNGEQIDQAEYIITPNGFDIPDDAAKLHGITTQKAFDEGISLASALGSLAYDLSHADFVVSHNIAYDEKIIGAEYIRSGLTNALEGKKTICTMLASVDFCAIPGPRGNKWPKLSELYQVLFAENLEGEHDAAVDCEAAARCFWELVEKGVIVLDAPSDSVDEMFPPIEQANTYSNDEYKEREFTIEENARIEQESDAIPTHEMSDQEVAEFLSEFEEETTEEIFSPLRLQNMIIDAYTELSQARVRLNLSAERSYEANDALKTRKTSLISAGQIDGKNETERKAQLETLTADETNLVRDAETNERDARFEFEMASGQVEMVRALLRVAELSADGRVER
jgi:DNA polymerase III epsilon subunit-like protein